MILDLGAGRDADEMGPSLSRPPSRSSTGNVLSDRAPVVTITAPSTGLNAPWGPRTILPVPTS
jgi:hypothetical protein